MSCVLKLMTSSWSNNPLDFGHSVSLVSAPVSMQPGNVIRVASPAVSSSFTVLVTGQLTSMMPSYVIVKTNAAGAIIFGLLSDPPGARFVFVYSIRGASLLNVTLPVPIQPGAHALRLAVAGTRVTLRIDSYSVTGTLAHPVGDVSCDQCWLSLGPAYGGYAALVGQVSSARLMLDVAL
jgi:hypothetical protein